MEYLSGTSTLQEPLPEVQSKLVSRFVEDEDFCAAARQIDDDLQAITERLDDEAAQAHEKEIEEILGSAFPDWKPGSTPLSEHIGHLNFSSRAAGSGIKFVNALADQLHFGKDDAVLYGLAGLMAAAITASSGPLGLISAPLLFSAAGAEDMGRIADLREGVRIANAAIQKLTEQASVLHQARTELDSYWTNNIAEDRETGVE